MSDCGSCDLEAERDEYKAAMIRLMSDLAWADGWIQSAAHGPRRSVRPTQPPAVSAQATQR